MRALVLLLGLLPLSACRSSEIVGGVNDSTFVRAMVALRRLPNGLIGDTVGRARMRDSVLHSLGISAVQLESAATKLAGDPNRAAALLQAIERSSAPPSR